MRENASTPGEDLGGLWISGLLAIALACLGTAAWLLLQGGLQSSMLRLAAPVALAGLAALLGAGYLAGAGRGRRSREDLRASLRRSEDSLLRFEARLRTQRDLELKLRTELEKRLELPAGDTALERTVRDIMGPLVARLHRESELAQLPAGDSLGALPALLDRIAETGGFSAVILSDERGLPLAASSASREVETGAGISALLMTVADKTAESGGARPIAVLLEDEAKQLTLHRIFSARGGRFVLSAVTHSRNLDPGALDPALAKLEELLAR